MDRCCPTRETILLHEHGLIFSDELPWLAARWLAADLVDTDSIRMLAGHDPQDAWGIAELLAASVAEASVGSPLEEAQRQQVAVDFVTTKWRLDRDTRKAVRTLAWLSETKPGF